MSIDRKGEREGEKFSVDTQCKWMKGTIDPCLLARLNPGDRLLTLFWNGMREEIVVREKMERDEGDNEEGRGIVFKFFPSNSREGKIDGKRKREKDGNQMIGRKKMEIE